MDPSRLDTESDEELVKRTLDGDGEGYRLLVQRYWSLIVGLALCRVKDLDKAEDIAQEAFIRVHAQLHRLRNPSAFSGWLTRITRNLSADNLRQGEREKTISLEDVSRYPTSAMYPISANPGMSEAQREFVWEAVGRLPEKFQTVVLMRFVSNLSAPEIAQRLGQRPMTIRVWLHRALKKLRKDLTQLRKEIQES